MWIEVLTALVVVVIIGLLFAILLAVIGRLFGVEEDEKTHQLREALPGINCGACGYKGCNDYAAALAQGTAKPNLCIPGAEATAAELGQILGVEVEPLKDVVAFVHCNGTCAATSERVICDGIATCKAKAMLFGGPGACTYGCLGCGDCAKVCVSHAICLEEGVARVNTDRCVGCGMCVKECPKGIISMVPQEAVCAIFCSSKDRGADARKACKNACIACKKCEKLCPVGAIAVKDNCAVIDYSLCTGCGACAAACPTGCLKQVSFPDLPEDFRLS